MPGRATFAVVCADEAAVDLLETLTAVLQGLHNVMCAGERCVLFEQDIELDPDRVASVIRSDTFEALDDWRETVRKVQQLLEHLLIRSLTGETGYVVEACVAPVVDNEEGEKTCASRIEPPEIGLVANEREEERKRVENDIGLTILRQGLDLRSLDRDAAEPNDAFHNDSC